MAYDHNKMNLNYRLESISIGYLIINILSHNLPVTINVIPIRLTQKCAYQCMLIAHVTSCSSKATMYVLLTHSSKMHLVQGLRTIYVFISIPPKTIDSSQLTDID